MYERFTDRARLVMQHSAEHATRRGYAQIKSNDVLFGMIREGRGVAGYVLRDIGIDQPRFAADIASKPSVQKHEGPIPLRHDISSDVRQIVEIAHQEAEWLHHHYVGTEHLLLGLCRVPKSEAVEALLKLGAQPGEIFKKTINMLGAGTEELKRRHPDIDFSSGTKLNIFDC